MQEPTFSIRDLASRLAPCGMIAPSDALPFMFGNTPELAQKLASLVAQRRKTATAGLWWAWEADDGGPLLRSAIGIMHRDTGDVDTLALSGLSSVLELEIETRSQRTCKHRIS